MHDVWIIGGELLNLIKQQYQHMKLENYPLYVWENYDVYLFSKTEGSYLMKLQAGILEGLKSRPRLPARIIIILDNEPFRKETVFYFKAMERIIKWICSMVIVAIKNRKEQLPHKAIQFGLPKVVVVKPIILDDSTTSFLLDPESGFRRETLKVKTQKYNSIIDKLVSSYSADAIDLSLDEDDSSMYCNGKTMLSPEGAQMYWISLCDELRKLDENRYTKTANIKQAKVGFKKSYNKSTRHHEDKWSTTAQVDFQMKHRNNSNFRK